MTARLDVPKLALSVRQPWAWAILAGHKPIENRNWKAGNTGLLFRGRVAIHASSGMTRQEYDAAANFMAALGVTCPQPSDLQFGAVIGEAEIVEIVKEHSSPWFVGKRGLVLRDAIAYPEPIPARGALGFFRWTEDPAYTVELAKWMLPAAVQTSMEMPPRRDLFGEMT